MDDDQTSSNAAEKICQSRLVQRSPSIKSSIEESIIRFHLSHYDIVWDDLPPEVQQFFDCLHSDLYVRQAQSGLTGCRDHTAAHDRPFLWVVGRFEESEEDAKTLKRYVGLLSRSNGR